MEELIRKLVEAYGPSGFEEGVRELIVEEIADRVEEMSVDAMGNLIAHMKGDGTGLKVMVAAHMDEIGVMVTHITEKGFLRFTNIGGVFPHTLIGGRVRFADGTVGVIDSEHLEDRRSVPTLDKHFIDIGATSRDECLISVGAAASFMRPLVAQSGRFIAKSMDDRIGCAVVIETLKRLEQTPHDVYFVFSVQEEVGTRGAQTAANAINPDVGISVDITPTGDTPGGRLMDVTLGKGPAIKIKDSGMIAHAGLVRLMQRRAGELGIPFQLEVLERGSTDARSMQVAGAGCAAGCISIPCRHAHTPSEMVEAVDVENAVKLLVAILSGPIDI